MTDTSSKDWESFPTELPSTAPSIGPFPHRAYLETAFGHWGQPASELHIETDVGGAVAFAVSENRVTLVGPENLTDYRSPLGRDPKSALVAALAKHPGATFRFDSLPSEASRVMSGALDELGVTYSIDQHEATAVLTLPESFEEWLASLGKKERHEVRRKRRRFDGLFGEATITKESGAALPTFAAMHRGSQGDKGSFMTGAMEAYFSDLMTHAGAVIHLMVSDGRPLAAAFGFETSDGYYYYNSAFDQEAASGSPGVVLFSSMIETQIERGAAVFDFLKGNEQYKFRHGAIARPLFAIEGTLP